MSSLSMTLSQQVRKNLIVVGSALHPNVLSYASGGSAKAAGELVAAQHGKTVEYLFIIGLPLLKGAEKLDAPVYTMIEAKD